MGRDATFDFEVARIPRLERATRTLVIVDIVESVRLIGQDEEGLISRWLKLVEQVEARLLPACKGRLVKSLGDGMLLEFSHVEAAVAAAFAIQHANARANVGVPASRQMLLRFGIEAGEVIIDRTDLYGHAVNLAERLLSLAGPGEIIISARARDELTADLDADIEDLGDCYLRHVPEPVRAYRIGPAGPHPVIEPGIPLGELRPSVAVVPFTARETGPEHYALGEVLAEEMIRDLSRFHEVNVISRLSTTAFRGREAPLAEISAHLNANYVLSGTYRVAGGRISIDAELAEAKSGQIVWSDRLSERLANILTEDRELIGRLTAPVISAVMLRELDRSRSMPLPTLKSYTLLMGAIALMHRLSRRDFEDARRLLQTLIDRATRQSIPQAWLAKWHVLRVQQGWSPDPDEDARLAVEYTQQALRNDEQCSLALAIDGLVQTNLLKRFDVAQERYDRAIEVNPNESLAWLLRGTLHAFMDHGRQAVADTRRAIRLSPLDPHRYFYDSLAATACLAAHDYEGAIELARRSLRANRTHTSTLRALAIAQWRLGQEEEARRTAQELLKLEPNLTIGRYLERNPSASFETGKEWSEALKGAGVPE